MAGCYSTLTLLESIPKSLITGLASLVGRVGECFDVVAGMKCLAADHFGTVQSCSKVNSKFVRDFKKIK